MSLTTARHQHHHGGNIYHQIRRGSSVHSSTSSLDDDWDAITPCPLETTTSSKPPHPQQQCQPQPQQRARPPNAAHRTESWRDSLLSGAPHHLEGLETTATAQDDSHPSQVDEETLWRRMLAIQRVFGCYNSARMQAALEMDHNGDSGFVPSRTCLDLLNDSIDQLPEESKRQLEEFLETGETRGPRSSNKRKSWRERLLHGPPVLKGL